MSDRASSPTPITPENSEAAVTKVQVKEEESLTLPLSPTTDNVKTEANPEPPVSSPGKIRRTIAQRRAYLRDDPQVQVVDSNRVMCRGCQKWIRLHGCYILSNWKAHKERCHGSMPVPRFVRRTPSKPSFSPHSRVATAERKIVLLNDPQVVMCSTRRVQCGMCKSMVALEGDVDYDLTEWIEHKKKCVPIIPAPITPQAITSHRPRFLPPSTSSTHSQVSTAKSPPSPTPVDENKSMNSTEATTVVETSSASEIGMKRDREQETEGEERVAADERPTNRARTETYRPPEGKAPGLLRWLMRPLEEFARGFREGLSST